MKTYLAAFCVLLMFACTTPQFTQESPAPPYPPTDPLITQSLFNDKTATLSEENVQRILSGEYRLAPRLRVAIVKLQSQRRDVYWNDETAMKQQQAYVDTMAAILGRSARVASVTVMPELMIAKPATITNLREAGVRMQADLVVVFSSITDTYSRYKLFSKTDIKAFATTQLLAIDTRTALVPFTFISTKDQLSQKTATDLDYAEARNRTQHEAVTITLIEAASKLNGFLAIAPK